jgi:hypothetical protein
MPRPGDKNIAARAAEWELLFLILEMGSKPENIAERSGYE